MGSGPSRSGAVFPPGGDSQATGPTARQHRAISNASCPAQLGPRMSVSTGWQGPPVWDPRSPSMARTPPKVVREIRASVLIQEQVVRQLEEQARREEKEKEERDRRKSTQLTSLPSQQGKQQSHLRKPRMSTLTTGTDATSMRACSFKDMKPLPTILSPRVTARASSGGGTPTGAPKAGAGVELETGVSCLSPDALDAGDVDENPTAAAATPSTASSGVGRVFSFPESPAGAAKTGKAAGAGSEAAGGGVAVM